MVFNLTSSRVEAADALYQLGNLQRREGMFKDAVDSYTRAISLNPYFEDAVHHLRIAIEEGAKLDEVSRDFRVASSLDPNSAAAHLYFGHMMLLQNKTDEAIKSYEKAIAVDPGVADAYYSLAEALARSSCYAEAIETYSKVIELEPLLSLPYSQIAHCLSAQGDGAAAAKYDKQALVIMSAPPLNVCAVPDDIVSDNSYRGYLRSAALDRGRSKHLPIITLYRELQLDRAASRSLVYCLAQAKKSNPKSDVILLGDAAHSFEFAHHDYVINYFKKAEEFAEIYKHSAKNVRFDFILFCFQRWFVLLEFMSAHEIDTCIHIDPDVMLYTDVTEWAHRHTYHDFRLSAHPNFGVCGHYNFVGSRTALEKYCNYLLDVYSNPPTKRTAAADMRWTVWEKRVGYITDMDAFRELRDTSGCSVEDLSTVADGSVWDANINSSDGFEMAKGMKDIYWIGEQPYCKALDSGAPVRFHALHFNGKAKKYMKNAFHKMPLWLEE